MPEELMKRSERKIRRDPLGAYLRLCFKATAQRIIEETRPERERRAIAVATERLLRSQELELQDAEEEARRLEEKQRKAKHKKDRKPKIEEKDDNSKIAALKKKCEERGALARIGNLGVMAGFRLTTNNPEIDPDIMRSTWIDFSLKGEAKCLN